MKTVEQTGITNCGILFFPLIFMAAVIILSI